LNRFPECAFVMTCADPAVALQMAPWLSGHHIFQKPYELDEISAAVLRMSRLQSLNAVRRLRPIKSACGAHKV